MFKNEAFTLVELIVAIAIIALIAVAVINRDFYFPF